ncbi:uncharacterized protein LOC121732692, partial [Aricia agestis]|uniref:uncharacterized protein LOC121732692 n=1 Tax=Aricia agestis TaxID=91739 RepID=UPI001C201E4D
MSEAKLKELVKRRGGYKAKLTYFANFVKLLPTSDLTPFQLSELQYRVSAMETLYNDFDTLQTELELLSENTSEAYAEREQFELLYYAQMGLARSLLEPPRPSSPPLVSAASTSDNLHGSGCKHDFVRLPKIDLPHFNGDYQHWLEFRDTYISLIHNNSSIQDINKFHYLRATLKGSAALVIKSIDFKADNYAIAWQLLTDRYNNERLLINNHVQALFNFELIPKESSASLRNMIDVTNKNLKALETLGQPTSQWDILIIFIMSKKLDVVTHREWEEFKNNLDKYPNLKDFVKFLSNRADLIESINNCNSNTKLTHNTNKYLQETKNKN